MGVRKGIVGIHLSIHRDPVALSPRAVIAILAVSPSFSVVTLAGSVLVASKPFRPFRCFLRRHHMLPHHLHQQTPHFRNAQTDSPNYPFFRRVGRDTRERIIATTA